MGVSAARERDREEHERREQPVEREGAHTTEHESWGLEGAITLKRRRRTWTILAKGETPGKKNGRRGRRPFVLPWGVSIDYSRWCFAYKHLPAATVWCCPVCGTWSLSLYLSAV